MATVQECEIIELIKTKKQKAKEDGKDIPYALSGGKEYFRKAINSVQLSGFFTMFMSILLAIFGVAIKAIQYIQMSPYYTINYGIMIGEFIGIILLAIVPIVLGAKVMKLETTPTFVLVSLIITLVFNIFFTVGVLPLVALILNIIALVRWSTYKAWFCGLKK
jgi:putative Ca2+/H+ antiporter (TMEM165/GDT1 family)